MKLQAKLILIILIFLIVSLGIFLYYTNVENEKTAILDRQELSADNSVFDKIVKLKEESLYNFSYDYSFWDEMVEFVSTLDKSWSAVNIDAALATYKANVCFIYNPEFKSVYQVNNLGLDSSKILSLSPIDLSGTVFNQKIFCHFFINSSFGLFEFHGAAITFSNDLKRAGPPKGYLLVGRIWDKNFVNDLASLSNSRIVVSALDKGNPFQRSEYQGIQKAYFSRALTDWLDRPLIRLDGVFEFKGREEINRFNQERKKSIVIFTLIGIIAAFSLFNLWIWSPLVMISQSLEKEDTKVLFKLLKSKDEFGSIARLIEKAFEQRKELFNEISKRELAERSLDEYASLLSATFEATMDGLLVVDLHRKIETFNQKFFKLWAFPPSLAECKDELVLLEYASGELVDGERFRRRIEELYSRPEIESYDIVKFKDGRVIEIFSQPQRLGRDIVGRVWSFRDMTERKHTEEAISRLKVAFEQSIDGIIILDLGGFVQFVNHSWALMHGYKVSELKGKHFSLFHNQQQLEKEVMPFNAIVLKEGSNEGEIGHTNKNGVVFQTWMTTSLLKNAENHPMGLVGIARDMSERVRSQVQLEAAFNELKKTQTQLTQSAKMAAVGELGGELAHEINNPLTGVLNNVQLIKLMINQNQELKPEEFLDLLDTIEESGQRCIRITRSLLDFSHASTGVFVPLDINGIIVKLKDFIGHEMDLENIKIELDLADNLPQISGDLQLLQQAVFNIISNAKWAIRKKGSQEQGRIIVKTENNPVDKTVFVFISDTGIGIPKENLDKIFDPFFSTKKVGEGTGLGMAIVSNIMNKHNGKIEVESESGKGTIFKLIFPAV